MAYADTALVTVTTAWTLIGTAPLGFTNSTGFNAEVFRKATAPAATDVGMPLAHGDRYENAAAGEVIYARLMPGPSRAAPSASVAVDQTA